MEDKMKGQCLDFFEMACKRKVSPVMFCHMNMDGLMDTDRIVEAIALTSRIIPQILWAYDKDEGCFVDIGMSPQDALYSGKRCPEDGWLWDVDKDTQLKIWIRRNRITIGMSHVLCDGAGFLQFLYLLSDIYNGKEVSENLKNTRDLSYILRNIKVQSRSANERLGARTIKKALSFSDEGRTSYDLRSLISRNEWEQIRDKMKQNGVTVNDVVLAAYARAIAEQLDKDRVVIPCPADLRRFAPDPQTLTIANMTGMYKVTINGIRNQTFTETIKAVHDEMAILKERCRCFAGISLLHWAYRKLPSANMRELIEKHYRILPVSYTNLGVIDDKRLVFEDIEIRSCYMTGAYRYAPNFQLSISTFRNECILNCTVVGEMDRARKSQLILVAVKEQLLDWIDK